MPVASPLLSQLIDDYIVWFVDWHRLSLSGQASALLPPTRFAAWRSEAIQFLDGEQPAIERITTLHEQLHKLVKLVELKVPQGAAIERKDDDSIAVKYMELMQELRRFERAFAAAAADLDPLTGLRTRVSLPQDLQREISRAARASKPFFVAIMDIDHFKTINDTYGHESGDRVLASVADQISRGLRVHDDAYRLGGEEFLLCLKETDAAGSLLALERLRISLASTPISLNDGRKVPVTASFGLATSAATLSPDALVRKADEALYRAKQQGRNRVVVAA